MTESNSDEFDEHDIKESLWDMVIEGKLAKIYDGKEWTYLNANQVMVKCDHCNNITNYIKKAEPEGK